MSLDGGQIIEGAKKLISKGILLDRDDVLVILTHEKHMRMAEYLLEAAKRLELYDVTLVQFPENMRPIKRIPTSLTSAIDAADALIYLVHRIPEEHEKLQSQIRQLCEQEKKCKYCFLSDPKLEYFQNAINADYDVVTQKCARIAEILRESRMVHVSSEIGTDISFRLHKSVLSRGPIIDWPEQTLYQAPEGEVMTTPIEDTFTGKLVFDGTTTSMGIPPEYTVMEFEKGRTTEVHGDKSYLNELLSQQRLADPTVDSLVGIWIAEFGIGANDWAVLDDNQSNSEKVSGTVHFGMGRTVVGQKRGEKFHFDSTMAHPTVTVTSKGRTFTLIESGKMQT